MLKRIISLALVCAMILCFLPVSAEAGNAGFVDVPTNAWFADPVNWAVENGITTGATATTFNPNGVCQRATVVTFLWRAAGSPNPSSSRNPFRDVKESDFYYKAVLWAVEQGITNGLTADTFGPFANCNRAQVVTFLHRAQGSPAVTSTANPFTDVVPSAFYGPAVLWAVKNGITNGLSATEFGINSTCNRAQVVTFLYRTANPLETASSIKVAAIETAYGSEVWTEVAAAFTARTGIQVELTTDRYLEDVISSSMQNGEYPDVVHLATGRPAGLTEEMARINALHPLTNALNMTIPGESVTPADKIIPGFTDNRIVAPYGDGVTYMAPMFYSPCGLFYNANLFEEKGWNVPTTWNQMWALGELAAAEGISLFTYPTVGYYDSFMFALMNAIGGNEFFDSITTYEEGAWDSLNGRTLLSIMDKLTDYTHPNTVVQANNQDFYKNQQMVMDGRALFMPNGTWITGEMADYASVIVDFEWGMTAIPSAGESPAAFSWFEQTWIPAAAENIDGAELFVAFLYSDEAAEIFASAGAMQPILGLSDMLEGETAMFYSIYDNGARAAVGGFAPFVDIPGVDIYNTFIAPIDNLTAGTMTIEEYADLVKTHSALMRENILPY